MVEEAVVGVDVSADHAQVIVGLARCRVAVLNLPAAGDGADEGGDGVRVVAGKLDVNDGVEVHPKLFRLQDGAVAFDDACLFQRAHPAPAGRR